MEWRQRIVGHGEEAPEGLLANPRNWRVHPRAQQQALEDVLDRVGWVGGVIVNKTTGHLVDGHLRVRLAVSKGEPAIPVSYVELSEDDEKAVLATLDPIGQLAETDDAKLRALISELESDDEALEKLGSDGQAAPPAPVSEADVAAARGKADDVFGSGVELVDLKCPHCEYEFAIEKAEL